MNNMSEILPPPSPDNQQQDNVMPLPKNTPVAEQNKSARDEPVEFNTGTNGPVLFGLLLILIVFVGFTIWAATAKLESAVSAPGTVVTESEIKTVQHLEGGIIKKILVDDGDTVHKGDTLIILDDTRAKASVEITRGQLYEALALAARLEAEAEEADKIKFPDRLLNDDSEKTREVMQDQRRLFDARRHSMQGQINILNQRISQYNEQIAGLKSQQKSREQQIKLYKQEIEGLEKLQASGNIAVNYVLDKKRQLEELQGEEGKFKADVAGALQGIGEAQLNIQQLHKNLHEEVIKELRDTRANIADLDQRLVAAQDTLDRTRITAPATGVVLGLSTHTIGGVVGPGVKILDIVPEGDELVFEVHVQTTDIDDVKVGQTATLRLSAFSYRHTIIIHGEVVNVSADTLKDPVTGQSYYDVKIRVPNSQLALLGDNKLVPGMPVQALIKTGDNTMLGYILGPLRDSLSRAFIEK